MKILTILVIILTVGYIVMDDETKMTDIDIDVINILDKDEHLEKHLDKDIYRPSFVNVEIGHVGENIGGGVLHVSDSYTYVRKSKQEEIINLKSYRNIKKEAELGEAADGVSNSKVNVTNDEVSVTSDEEVNVTRAEVNSTSDSVNFTRNAVFHDYSDPVVNAAINEVNVTSDAEVNVKRDIVNLSIDGVNVTGNEVNFSRDAAFDVNSSNKQTNDAATNITIDKLNVTIEEESITGDAEFHLTGDEVNVEIDKVIISGNEVNVTRDEDNETSDTEVNLTTGKVSVKRYAEVNVTIGEVSVFSDVEVALDEVSVTSDYKGNVTFDEIIVISDADVNITRDEVNVTRNEVDVTRGEVSIASVEVYETTHETSHVDDHTTESQNTTRSKSSKISKDKHIPKKAFGDGGDSILFNDNEFDSNLLDELDEVGFANETLVVSQIHDSDDTHKEKDDHIGTPSVIFYPKCCPPTEVLYLPKSSHPKCEPIDQYNIPPIQPPSLYNMTVTTTWQPKLTEISCGEDQLYTALPPGQWLLDMDTLVLVGVDQGYSITDDDQGSNITEVEDHGSYITSYCLDYGIQDGQELQLFSMACMSLSVVCSRSVCLSVCPGIDQTDLDTETVGVMSKEMECSAVDTEMILDTGSGVRLAGGDKLLGLDEYCVHSRGQGNTITGPVCRSSISISSEEPDELLPYKMEMMKYLYLTSVVSLFITLSIHLVVPELRSSVFGWMKISHLTAMFVTYSAISVISFGGLSLILDFNVICTIIGFFTHFFFLAGFFWLNIMSIDIWRTFRNMRGYGNMINRMKRRRRRFLCYSLYAWGCPLVICLLTLAVELIPDLEISGWKLPKPGHGERQCFFKDWSAKVVYWFIPVIVLLALDLIFFILASWSLVYGVWAASANDRVRRPTKQRFSVVVCLFFSMGLPWLADPISGMIDENDSMIVFIFDIINSLNGFIIFVIFICKNSVIQSIKRFLRNMPPPHQFSDSIRNTITSTLSNTTSMKVSSKQTSLRKTAISKSTVSAQLSMPIHENKCK